MQNPVDSSVHSFTKSTDHLTYIKETFAHFDKTGAGTIDPSEFGNFLYARGLNPLGSELQKITKDLGTNPLTFETAFTYYQSMSAVKSEITTDQLYELFMPFDMEQNGRIKVAEFRNITTQLGDKLTDEEVDFALSGIEISQNGTVAYK
ncbi:hypothetical protein HZS_1838, partial [Henneguya salminicola]